MNIPTPRHLFNVRDFGACGNGRDKDTGALRRALEACHAAGGGTVYCPPGTYLTGSIELKSHVELRLEAGATILGSPDRADYLRVHEGDSIVIKFNFDEHLICARNARNVAVTGRGTIDGNGRAFLVPHPDPRKGMVVRDWRPGQMIAFFSCQDVLLRDVHLVDSPSWTVWPLGCDRVTIQGITIRNNRETPNADGIDLICCRDVRVSDCSIDAGDDCIAIYSMPYWLEKPRPSENIVVTNCVFSTRCCGFRLGYSADHPIRNCSFSNIVMRNTHTGIDLLVPVSNEWRIACEPPVEHGPLIENISFSNFVMDTNKAIFLWIGDDARPPAGMRNIQISNLIATTHHACYVGGSRQVPIDGVRISNLKLTMKGEPSARHAAGVPYPVSRWGCPGIPHAFFLRHARNLEMHDVRVDWGTATGPWQSAVRAEEVENLDITGLTARQAPGSSAAVAHLINVRGARIGGCRAEAGTGTFVQVEGDASANIAMIGNHLARAQRSFALADGLSPDRIEIRREPVLGQLSARRRAYLWKWFHSRRQMADALAIL